MSHKASGALLNEYKGYLFEFLVAKHLRELANLDSIETKLNENQFQMLSQQESFVRNNYPVLLERLPFLAKETAREVMQFLENKNLVKSLNDVLLSGKENTSLDRQSFSEEDIALLFKDLTDLKISLKLAKSGLATNTKSSGVLSIFDRYFSRRDIQSDFNSFLDIEFENMSRDLHEIEDIEYQESFKNWKKLGLPELPGSLNDQASQRLRQYYATVAKKMSELFESIDANDLNSGLVSLAGFSHPNVVQVTCFYKANYQLEGVSIYNSLDFGKKLVKNHQKSMVVFEGEFAKVQLRVKPMNVFTTKAFKVNASLSVK